MAEDARAVGGRVKAARATVVLTQRELAGRAGISYAYLSRIESGSRSASWEVLAALAGELETTGLCLLTGHTGADCPFCGRHG